MTVFQRLCFENNSSSGKLDAKPSDMFCLYVGFVNILSDKPVLKLHNEYVYVPYTFSTIYS